MLIQYKFIVDPHFTKENMKKKNVDDENSERWQK